MTTENKYVDDFKSSYQGKTWKLGKIIAIFAVVFVCFVVRDLGMTFIYGSIYDKFAEEGIKASISIMNYVYMVLLFILPMVLPLVLRFTCGAYDNEIENPLLPSFDSKVLNLLMYFAAGLLCVVPVVLLAVGLFTAAYMFVTLNIALLIFSSVVIFYYLGTYILQRARVPLAKKHILPNVFMLATSVLSMLVTSGIVFILYKNGKAPIVTYFLEFAKDWTKAEIIAKGVGMFLIIGLALLVAGLLYILTQNIIYSATPAVIFANANVIILQRLKETTDYFARYESTKKSIAEATRPQQKAQLEKTLEELKLVYDKEAFTEILCYVLIGVMVLVLVALLVRAILGIVKLHKAGR